MHCSDPESFVRGGPTLTTSFFFFFFLFILFFDEGRRDPNAVLAAINGATAKHHLNGISLVGRSWPNIECWIGSFVILRGSGPVLLKELYIFAILQEVPYRLPPAPTPHLWIRTCSVGNKPENSACPAGNLNTNVTCPTVLICHARFKC